MRTIAVLPIKRFGEAKQRLGEALEPNPRETMARAMVRDVTAALAQTAGLEAVLVVTSDLAAHEMAGAHGFEVVEEDGLLGHSGAATLGVRRAMELGAERVLLVPGDCPALTADELDALLARHRSPGVVVVPDRHGAGTNALLLAPPDVIAPAFGEGSCRRHRALAASAGAACAIDPVDGLALDVDDADDLDEVRRAGDAAGEETRAALRRLALAG